MRPAQLILSFILFAAPVWAATIDISPSGVNDAEYLVSTDHATLSADDVVTEGLAIDYTNGAGTGTFAFDPTELTGNRTWDDGATSTSIRWTWNLSAGTDPFITFADGKITLDPGGNDLIVDDDIEIFSAAPYLSLTDSTAAQDDFSWQCNTSACSVTNDDDSVTYLAWTALHAITLGHASVPSITLTTDGTGTGELVVPNDSITLGTETDGSYAAGDAEAGAALTGDTATAFFSVGTLEHERGGLEADVSAYDGLIGITGGATYNQTGTTTQIVIFDGAGAPTSVALSGDATMTNAGVVTVVDDLHAHTTTSISSVDISADTNLTAGDNLTLTDDDLDLDAAVSIATSITAPIFVSNNADPADAGIIRLGNTEGLSWEVAPAGTDATLTLDASEILQIANATLDGADLTSGTVTATQLGTDSVSADELNATGVEAELEAALDIGGEVTSTGMASTVIADSVAVTDWNLTTPTFTTTALLVGILQDNDDMVFEADANSDGTNKFSFTDGAAAEVASLSEAGLLSVLVGIDAIGAVDMDYGSADVTDHTFVTDGTGTAEVVLPAGSIDSTEVLDDTLTASDMNATLTFADSDLLDLDAINLSSTTEGLLLPQATAATSATAEGQIGWETGNDRLMMGNGSTALPTGAFVLGSLETSSNTSSFNMGLFGSDGGEEGITPVAMKCDNFYASIDTAPGIGGSWTATLDDDGVGTSLTCTITHPAIACNLTGTITDTIAAGSQMRTSWTATSVTAGTGGSNWGARCWNAP